MNLTGVAVFALCALAGTAIATPRESTTFPATVDSASNGATGGGHTQTDGTVTLNQAFTGGYTAVRINMTGSITSVNAGTYASEARIYVTPPAPAAPFTIQPFAQATYTTLSIPAGYGVALAGGTGFNPVGNWSYIFFESYQDGAGGSVNSTWSDLVLTFDDAAPPPPPPPTADIDFGILSPSPDFLAPQSINIDTMRVGWVKFNLPQTVTTVNGRYLDIDTQGSTMADTYMVFYDNLGTPITGLINDDSGIGFLSLMSFGTGIRPGPGGDALNYGGQNGNLNAGTYWLAVCDYFPTGIDAGYQITPGGDLGSITVNLRYNEGPPPAPPTTFFNMGTIPTDGSLVTHTFGLDPATVKWAKITIGPIDAVANTFLDLDTETSTALTSAICLFKPDGTIAGQDTIDGSDNLSQLTFGAGSRSPVGNGALYNGRDGATLAAGEYFVAVSMTPAAFASGWQAASSSADLGDVVLRVRSGTQLPPAPPTTFFNMGAIPTNGNFVTHTFTLDPATVKWAKITIGDVAAASLTFLDLDTETSTALSTAICMFKPDGTIQGQDTIDGSDNLSQLTFGAGTRPTVGNGNLYNGRDGATVAAGDYFVAVALTPATFVAGWQAFSSSVDSGDAVLRVRTGTQPPPAPPAVFTDLGTLANGVTTRSSDLAAGEVKWFKFIIASDVSAAAQKFLDVDTETSVLAGGAFADDTYITLFDNVGAIRAQDDDSGSGFHSQLTFGQSVPTRPAVGDGATYNGRNGVLVAGTYWLAAYGYPNSVGSPAAGWIVGSTSLHTGTIVVNLTLGTATYPPGTFVKTVDGGETADTAIVATGTGNLNAIAGAMTVGHADLFRIAICDFANFSATTVGGAAFDTQLFLFKSGGEGVTFCDDNVGGIAGQSSITSINVTHNGIYIIAISQYNRDPVDVDGALIWNDQPFEGERAPDGPAALNPVASWNGASATVGSYVISLTGACFIPSGPTPCNAADVAGLGGSIGPDHFLTPDDIIVFLNAFFTGNLAVADIAVLGGNPGHDGMITPDDLIYFLDQFFRPCNP